MIEFTNGASIFCGACSYLDIYYIDVDDERIELNDMNRMVAGTIGTDKLNDVEVMRYNEKGFLTGEIENLKELL